MTKKAQCVVLNNQIGFRVAQAVKTGAVIVQPHGKTRMTSIERALRNGPLDVYFVTGGFGDKATAVGQLVSLDSLETLTSAERARVEALLFQEQLYGPNILDVRDMKPLDPEIPSSAFVKVSDGQPLKPGRWRASLCYVPEATDEQ